MTSQPYSFTLRPLDELHPANHLLGDKGINRAPTSSLQIAATTDLEALSVFLMEYSGSSGTYRIYRRECERLFLWVWAEVNKPVSSLNRQDFEQYLQFLSNPSPPAIWCGPKSPKASPQWRPFVGPLSDSAILTAIAAVNSLMSYLVDAGYLLGNPLGLIRQRRNKLKSQPNTNPDSKTSRPAWSPDDGGSVERFLDAQMWEATTAAIEAMPEETSMAKDKKERLRFICSFLYLLAPRAGELETMRMNSFRESRGLWWWHVKGKGQKVAKVPVPDDMLAALVRYRKHLGLSAVPTPSDETPLLISVRTGKPITARRLNQLLKELFSHAAQLLPPDAEHKKEKLASASAHWGRHTGITAKVDAGMDTRYVQRDARHADARTTGLYIHEEEERWHQEAQKHEIKWVSKTNSSS